MIKIKQIATILLAAATISVSAKDYKTVDSMPELKKDEMSTWLLIFRDKNRQSNELYTKVYLDGKLLANAEDNTLSMVEIPADGKEGVIYIKAEENTEEYMNIVPQPGKIYFLHLIIHQYGGGHSHEEIMLSLLSPDEAIKQLDEADDIHKMEFCIPKKGLGEMKERKWNKILEEYEEWKEESPEDYNKNKNYKGFDKMFEYDFSKKK